MKIKDTSSPKNYHATLNRVKDQIITQYKQELSLVMVELGQLHHPDATWNSPELIKLKPQQHNNNNCQTSL